MMLSRRSKILCKFPKAKLKAKKNHDLENEGKFKRKAHLREKSLNLLKSNLEFC
jgi:hypothetical protein